MSDNLTIHSTGRDSEGRFVIRIAGAVSELDCLRRIEKVVEAMRTERASLESRLAFAERMLERAKDIVHMAIDCPNCCTKSVQTFNADLERGSEGVESEGPYHRVE